MTISLDTLIAIIALILAIASFIYTWYVNDRYSIEVSECCRKYLNSQKFIMFEVVNTSTRPLELTSLCLYRNNETVKDNGFDPIKYGEDKFNRLDSFSQQLTAINHFSMYAHDESENFHKKILLLPNEKVEFSYYVDVIPNKITILSNKKIYNFKKVKSFIINFDEID